MTAKKEPKADKDREAMLAAKRAYAKRRYQRLKAERAAKAERRTEPKAKKAKKEDEAIVGGPD